MPISVSNIQGCCHGYNFYNLGGAHQYQTARDQNQFDDWLATKLFSTINIAITNHNQAKTREYLKNAGWKTHQVGNLWISTIDYTTFNNHRLKTLARQREEAKLKEAERKKKEEELRKQQQEKLKFASSISPKKETYKGLVRYQDIQQFMIGPNAKENIEKYYNITLPDNYRYDRYGYSRSLYQLRDYIYSLVKKTRDNE